MKTKSKSLAGVVSIILLLLGASLGVKLSLQLYLVINWPWKQREITVPQDVNNILYVASRYLFDPTGDVLFVANEDNTVFSTTLFQEDWRIVAFTPDQTHKSSPCPTEWLPLIRSNIVDSASIQRTGEFTDTRRCYILFNDGSLQIRTRELNMYTASIIGVCGLISGAVFGVFIGKRIY